ncbi:MotA/TolQ/ExbB proton channel family protein [Plebeiibacterium sediminum]|uniref:MotA/TolQ/ExbB proton channel family protein n=1 Tax=Plebeiibacterium sediminum TaxID=2992112 RepID=A0AAE3M7N0_9BACT|nr:MotA/TolQ/ExbB proton channel family protein [Plebeiobacterium sediminum]MCW3788512.1 MotA/TolQ/ExbB proton channel family protein [Plebeiobacterium sediminum]
MIIRLFFEGGTFFMSLVYSMWILAIVQAIRFIILYRGIKNPQKLIRINNSILFFGSLSFLFGITGQMIGLIAAFDAIQCLGNASIKPDMLAGGLKVTFIAPLFGITFLIITAIIWFVLGNLKKYPSQNGAIIQ